uniref:SSNA1 protein n=2 Tax=Passeriformes TaxID=9126 RepID=A0A8C5JNH2_JUNHY
MEHTGTLLSNCPGGMLPGSEPTAGCPALPPGLTPAHITAVPADGCCRTQMLCKRCEPPLGLPSSLRRSGSRATARPGKLRPFGPAPGWGDRQGGWARGPSLTAPSGHRPHTPRSPSRPPPAAPAVSPRPRQPRPFLPQPPPILPQARPFPPGIPGRSPSTPAFPPSALAVPPGSGSPGSSHPAPRTQSRRGPAGEEPRPEHPGGGGSGLPRARRSAAVPAHQPQRGGRHQRGAERVPGGRELHSGRRKGRSGGAAPAAAMSGTGAALRGHHAALQEGLSELRARRDELNGRIQAEEAERGRLQARIATLSRRLSDTSENLAGLRSTRAHIDRTIAEMDLASGEILDNSQTLLDVLKKEMRDLGKIIDPQNTSLGQRIRRQKRS